MRYRVGEVVTDAQRALTGRVRGVHGGMLVLVRPSGYLWEAAADQCWAASPEERESLTPRGAVRVISTSPSPARPSS
ncbi:MULTISPECIES: hypothetical protein [unclassified Streptomyces]|uniref:hypothetical protein n=1 Tax=unclassified Streptomyces TaxID=2593676 RepID=UPI0006FEB13E|nr:MULTISPECIES: hypothetical protein [unclassified Streptomyces]KQX59427.1 hypothetical protein ASD33_03880 [Streptomyces sp. Root1304]KRB00687.1 hypothetical protein ASE09_03880 [Streptomyces sp. Root66D1]